MDLYAFPIQVVNRVLVTQDEKPVAATRTASPSVSGTAMGHGLVMRGLPTGPRPQLNTAGATTVRCGCCGAALGMCRLLHRASPGEGRKHAFDHL